MGGLVEKRIIELIDNVPHYRCSDCKEMKTSDKFMKNTNMADGVHYYCRECMKIRRERTDSNKVLLLKDSQQQDVKEQTTIILENLGFDMDRNISEQFIHRLKYKYNIDVS